MKLHLLYQADPKTALAASLVERLTPGMYYTSTMGDDGVRYGSYKRLGAADFHGRTYVIEWVDCEISIYWLDAIYSTNLRVVVRI